MPLSDKEIRQYVAKHKMITPFESSQIRFKKGEKADPAKAANKIIEEMMEVEGDSFNSHHPTRH